jgi:ABC-type phosphate/phosphonate transport system substrate-binding protein
MVVSMRSAKMIVAAVVVAVAMTACSSSSKPSSGTTPKPASAADFCAKIQNEIDAFHITSFAGKTPDELKSTYSSLAQKLEKLESEAPSAISDDFTTFVTFTKRVQATLADVNYDPAQLSISDITGLFSSQARTAATHVLQYVTANCHFTAPTS